MKIYRCMHCGNIITKLSDKGVNVVCCGDEMILLEANNVDASLEKHVPVVEIIDNNIKVTVGEVNHPMEDSHYIEFIIIETENGICVRKLKPNDEPIIDSYINSKVLNVYAYCNLHGLWKANI